MRQPDVPALPVVRALRRRPSWRMLRLREAVVSASRCVKVRYTSEVAARGAAQIDCRVQAVLHDRRQAPLRPYRCPKCRGWHLTKQDAGAYWSAHPGVT